jgi:hypothetical protein
VRAADPEDPKRPTALPATGPLTVGQVVELAVTALSRRWSVALVLAIVFVGPAAIATAAFGMRFDDVALGVIPGSLDVLGGSGVLTANEAEQLIGAAIAYVGATLVAGLLGSIGAVAFSRLLAPDVGLGGTDLSDALGVALRRAPSIVAFGLVTGGVILALAFVAGVAALALLLLLPAPSGSAGGPGAFGALVVGVALVVAVIYLSLRWGVAFAVMAFEEAGWRRAIARSWELSAERIWRVLAVLLLGTLVSLLFSVVVTQLLAIAVVDWAGPALGVDELIARSFVVAAGAIVVAPITPLFVAALYVDLRRRHGEGLGSGPVADVSAQSDQV